MDSGIRDAATNQTTQSGHVILLSHQVHPFSKYPATSAGPAAIPAPLDESQSHGLVRIATESDADAEQSTAAQKISCGRAISRKLRKLRSCTDKAGSGCSMGGAESAASLDYACLSCIESRRSHVGCCAFMGSSINTVWRPPALRARSPSRGAGRRREYRKNVCRTYRNSTRKRRGHYNARGGKRVNQRKIRERACMAQSVGR